MAVYKDCNDSLFLDELYLYGTKRLEIIKEKQHLATKVAGITLPPIQLPNMRYTLPPIKLTPTKPKNLKYTIKRYNFGKKHYELTDWLGNVRVVINDKKTPMDTNPQNMTYQAQTISVSDYYPFGMLARSYSSGGYRFGFNGQEKTDEIKGSGNHYTAPFWEYNPRTVHRWNIDSEYRRYPGESPYLINHGNPIWYSDPLGNDGKKRAERFAAKNDGIITKVGEGEYTVQIAKTFIDEETGFVGVEIELRTFKDNIFERAVKSIARFGNRIDNFLKGDPTELGKIDTKEGSALHRILKEVAGLNPLVSVPNAVKILTTGEDIYEQEATSTIDKVLAGAALIAPFNPGANASKVLLGNPTVGEVIDNINTSIQFANDVGLLDDFKNENPKNNEDGKNNKSSKK